MPARPDDPQWLKDAYAEGRIAETSVRTEEFSPAVQKAMDLFHESLSETNFEAKVVAFAQAHGWAVMAVRRNVCVQRADGTTHRCTPWLYDGVGWPDLVLVRGRVLFVELKSDKGIQRDEQEVWEARLHEAKADYYLFRPRDWATIEEVLK
jgi:hypothetical protein